MRRSDFLTPRENLYIKWSHLKFFIYKMFHQISRFQNLEVAGRVEIKPRKKRMLISHNLIQKDGEIIVMRRNEKKAKKKT